MFTKTDTPANGPRAIDDETPLDRYTVPWIGALLKIVAMLVMMAALLTVDANLRAAEADTVQLIVYSLDDLSLRSTTDPHPVFP